MAFKFSEWFRWQSGRQGTGYDKMFLAGGLWPIPFDMYLLRFLPGNFISPHCDRVTVGKHHRVNIVVKSAVEGGEFICPEAIYESKRIKYFRPDIAEHSVTEVIEGNRYVFSIGWVTDSKQSNSL